MKLLSIVLLVWYTGRWFRVWIDCVSVLSKYTGKLEAGPWNKLLLERNGRAWFIDGISIEIRFSVTIRPCVARFLLLFSNITAYTMVASAAMHMTKITIGKLNSNIIEAIMHNVIILRNSFLFISGIPRIQYPLPTLKFFFYF